MSSATINSNAVVHSLASVLDRFRTAKGDESSTTTTTKQISPDRMVEIKAAELLEKHPHFLGRCQFVRFHCTNQRLCIRGCLPSFFLKQLVQEAMRELDGVLVENQVVVASPKGEIREHQNLCDSPERGNVCGDTKIFVRKHKAHGSRLE